MATEKYVLIISEPWDFVGPKGKNCVSGKITREYDDSNVLFELDYNIEINGVSGNHLILSSRYEKENLAGKNVARKTVNVGILPQKIMLDDCVENIKKAAQFSLIGTLLEKE